MKNNKGEFIVMEEIKYLTNEQFDEIKAKFDEHFSNIFDNLFNFPVLTTSKGYERAKEEKEEKTYTEAEMKVATEKAYRQGQQDTQEEKESRQTEYYEEGYCDGLDKKSVEVAQNLLNWVYRFCLENEIDFLELVERATD